MKKYLIVEDGTFYQGKAIGSPIIATGELAFFTGNYGFQEALTDPTNAGKILVFTTPVVGGTGINAMDYESINPVVKGVIFNDLISNVTGISDFHDLEQFLTEKQIPGICDVDTRALVKRYKRSKDLKVSLMDTNDEHAFDQIKALVLPKNKSANISTKNAYAAPNVGHAIAVIDLGLKHSLLRSLSLRKANITVLPYNAQAEDLDNLRPKAIVISNGPGSVSELPASLYEIIDKYYGKLPILGIGLGFLALAEFLKFERAELPHPFNGVNFPVIEQNSKWLFQSSMNIDELVYPDSIKSGMDRLFFDIHTDLVCGFQDNKNLLLAAAFNPEGAPGGWGGSKIFDYFIEMIDRRA
ncbi:MAG: carbamoyl phosphate synthase small subunit [Lactobacillus sp.]|nr:carbamoyl phosphate synthase small subunit [Lactobacillus sp.]